MDSRKLLVFGTKFATDFLPTELRSKISADIRFDQMMSWKWKIWLRYNIKYCEDTRQYAICTYEMEMLASNIDRVETKCEHVHDTMLLDLSLLNER